MPTNSTQIRLYNFVQSSHILLLVMSSPLHPIAVVCFMMAAIVVSTTNAQSSYHSDAFRNSFTVKVPGSQQTFTRFFGGQPGAVHQQQQQQAQHQAQVQFSVF